MKKQVQEKVLEWANVIEIFIAVLLSVAIGILSFGLIVNFKDLILSGESMIKFNEFLEAALNLVVGVEFIKMLCRHTPETVIEVLLFAMARHLVVSHSSTLESFTGIASIAVLFAVKRYLLSEKEEKIIED